MAEILEERGYGTAYALEGGFDAWKAAGYETAPAQPEHEVPAA